MAVKILTFCPIATNTPPRSRKFTFFTLCNIHLSSATLLVNNPMSYPMMLRSLPILLLLLPSILRAADPSANPRAFDVINAAYGPYVEPNDPLALPAKVRALSADRYAFWRGAKDIFFLWCKNNTQ